MSQIDWSPTFSGSSSAVGSINWTTMGFSDVMMELKRELEKIAGRTVNGMNKAAMLILNDALATPPVVPRDTGNLRDSHYVVSSTGKAYAGARRWFGGRGATFRGPRGAQYQANHLSVISTRAGALKREATKGPMVEFGYTVPYAVLVHEAVKTNFHYPQSGAKFLEASVKRNMSAVLVMIASEAKK